MNWKGQKMKSITDSTLNKLQRLAQMPPVEESHRLIAEILVDLNLIHNTPQAKADFIRGALCQ